jgi:hypothetical protein
MRVFREGRKDKQSVLNEGRDNIGKDKEDQSSHTGVEEDRQEQSERCSEQDKRNYVIMIAELILTLY